MNRSGHYHFDPPGCAKVSCSFANKLGSIVAYDLSRDTKPGQDITFNEQYYLFVSYLDEIFSFDPFGEVISHQQREDFSSWGYKQFSYNIHPPFHGNEEII